MSETFNTVSQLKRILLEGKVSEDSIRKITEISERNLSLFLSEELSDVTYSTDEELRLSMLTAQLISGLEIDDDDRITGIIDGLIGQFLLSLENIALLTNTDVQDIQDFLSDPTSVSSTQKYKLSSRVSYLNLAIANARPA